MIGEKTMNPAGFLRAFSVDEEMYEKNRSVAVEPEHQPLREPEWFYTNFLKKRRKSIVLKQKQKK